MTDFDAFLTVYMPVITKTLSSLSLEELESLKNRANEMLDTEITSRATNNDTARTARDS